MTQTRRSITMSIEEWNYFDYLCSIHQINRSDMIRLLIGEPIKQRRTTKPKPQITKHYHQSFQQWAMEYLNVSSPEQIYPAFKSHVENYICGRNGETMERYYLPKTEIRRPMQRMPKPDPPKIKKK